jgi:hypothetical protein
LIIFIINHQHAKNDAKPTTAMITAKNMLLKNIAPIKLATSTMNMAGIKIGLSFIVIILSILLFAELLQQLE